MLQLDSTCGVHEVTDLWGKKMQDFLTGPSGKRKRDEFASQYQNQTGGYIPQQDGAGDVVSDVLELEVVISLSVCQLLLSFSSWFLKL